VRWAFQVRVVGLPGQALSQAPQSAHREDDGEERGYAEREERKDPEEDSAGVGNPAADKSHPSHVGEKDDRPKDRPEDVDDIPRSPSGEHQRSVQPDNQYKHSTDVLESSGLEPADDVVRQVKRHEEDREQRRDS
jgi:hypothetical protein